MDSQVTSEGSPLSGPRRRTRRSTERIWPKRILKPFSFFLTTGDETDTVDRLFVSRHVNDLRLIVATGFVILIVVLLLAIAVAASTALVDPSPAGSAPEAQRLLQSSTAAGAIFLKLFAPTFALFGAVLTWAYQTGNSRLGVVDLFACEIDTLCRVITVVDMVGNLTKNYTIDPSRNSPDDKDKAASPARFDSQEDYFPILASNSRDLQSLEANVVVNITAFYTFMKAVRDTLKQLGEAKSAKQWQESTRNVIYMLYLGLEAGRHAMNDLVEFEPTHTERTIVVLLSELDAYYFLRDKFRDPDEMHNEKLILRGPTYAKLVPQLNRVLDYNARAPLVKAKRGALRDPTYAESQWLAALQLSGALNARFNRLQANFPLDCFAAADRVVSGTMAVN